jgi:hypothetical protein
MRGSAEPYVPYVEPIAGGAWWTIGAAALDAGVGTVVLAGGLGVTAGLVVALKKRYGTGVPLPPRGRGRFLRLLGITVALVAVAGTVLGYFGLGELTVPIACAMVGVALILLSSQLDERIFLAAGGALMVLGAVGALLALDSAGNMYPQGLVGLVAGGILWLAGAYRTGLLDEARQRVRH